ncbi:T9SS type A sorting domain-containing protein [Bacteroidota bacterium]
MKKFAILFCVLWVYLCHSQIPPSVDSAYKHIEEQFDEYHQFSYVYLDDNSGANIFIPSIWQGGLADIYIKQDYSGDYWSGRSSTRIIFPLSTDTAISAIKYVYPENNTGLYRGFDMSGASELSFYAKGEGEVEFFIGGMNRRPFYDSTLLFQDGVDIRSTGFVSLSSTWQQYSIDLQNNTFWVYLDSTAGLNNKYIQPMFMDSFSYFSFNYGAPNGMGGTCMKIDWFGDSTLWAGVFLFPPQCNWDSTQGYDLSGIEKIHYKAKISSPGKVKFLFGKNGDSCGELTNIDTLTTAWQWYEWDLDSTLNYNNVIGGFGFFFGGDNGTPSNSSIFIDSVFYEGVELASDFSNLICGLTISADSILNQDSVLICIDEIKYDKNRTEKPRFCQSYVCWNDTIDITQKNASYTYDNALKLIADLALYDFDTSHNYQYIENAKKVGDALIYAIHHDRFFNDYRLRNAYMSGEMIHYDSTVRMPGWWDEDSASWYEDIQLVSTSTGNMAWAGIALTSLYEVTMESQYLNASELIANWCIDSTGTSFGFTGGFEGWGPIGQTKLTWKSTEHNIDLYALFKRLFYLTNDSSYFYSYLNAGNFVISMWDSTGGHFWTGTDNTGVTINTTVVPLDIQAWYIMAFKDTASSYINGINWGNQNCYLANYNSQNYSGSISGFDFNNDKDGIWYEGSAQAVLANKMIGNHNFTDSILTNIKYIQENHLNPKFYNCNSKGIVAADHNNISTGFDWEYHNRLHIGATCWYIFAVIGFNPYYYEGLITGIDNNENTPTRITNNLFESYPNPFTQLITINYDLKKASYVEIKIISLVGKEIRLLVSQFESEGKKSILWDGKDNYNNIVSPGTYFCVIKNENNITTDKIIFVR